MLMKFKRSPHQTYEVTIAFYFVWTEAFIIDAHEMVSEGKKGVKDCIALAAGYRPVPLKSFGC